MSLLYDRIQYLCDIHGTTVYALEKVLGLKNGTIRKWKEAVPYISNVHLVADYFNTSLDYLQGRTDNPLPTGSDSTKALQEVLNLINKYNNFNNELEQLIEKYDIKALSNTPVLTGEPGNEPESEEETK